MSNELTATTNTVAGSRLQQIEWEIQYHVERAAGHLIDIGRCLNEAKDEGLVPHGQWQEWVLQHTRLTVRGAQRVMQAAREIPKASALTHLEFSKVQALLALPADEREGFADQVGAGDLSVRELQAAIKAKQEAEERARKAESARAALEKDIPKLAEEQAQGYIKEISEDFEQAKKDARYYQDMKVMVDREVERLQEQVKTWKQEAACLHSLLNDENAPVVSKAAQVKLDQLQAEIDEKEAEIERQANLRAEAQQELLRLKAQTARGETANMDSVFCVDALVLAVRTFLCVVGVMPYKGTHFAAISEDERETYRQYIDMMQTWVDGSRQALNTVSGDCYVYSDGGEA